MKKVLLSLTALFLLNLTMVNVSHAASFTCPAPSQINCIPAINSIGGWKANGGQMTGNTFAPNNQCANVIVLPNNANRLLCCYTKCGVFIMDVPFTRCSKVNQSRFICN